MAGLLDFIQTPAGMGLLSAVAGGLAGARRGTPLNNVGRGALAGLTGYATAQDQIRQDQENAFQKQFRQMQMDDMQQKMARERAIREFGQVASKDAMIPGSHGPLGYKPTDPNAFVGQLAQGGTPEDMAFNQSNIAAIAEGNNALAPEPVPQFDENAYRKAMQLQLAQAGFADEAMKFAPEKVKPIALGKTLVNPETGETIAVDATWKDDQVAQREQRMQELQMRLQDQRISREEQMALRRELAGQNAALRRDLMIQGNKPPAGYRYTADGSLEAIPGGPADIKAGELGAKAEQRRMAALQQSQNVLDTVKDAKGMVGYSTTGIGGTLKALPMTRARDLDAKLETIKANLGFDRLQQMRETSPTGGALGQVAVQELTALQATVASLDQLQNPTELKKALGKIETHYKNWQETMNGNLPKGTKPIDKRAAYNEYIDAYKRAKTPEQRKAITDRARQLGVVK